MALVSLLTGRTVRGDTAMTGEISLRGLVLPVGGIKEKVIAAAHAGLVRVMLPARNRRDYDDIPSEVREKLQFIWLERVDEAIAGGLEERPTDDGDLLSCSLLPPAGPHDRPALVNRDATPRTGALPASCKTDEVDPSIE
jgi:predicted ATP-dependent protease